MEFPLRFNSVTLPTEAMFAHIWAIPGDVSPQHDRSNFTNSWGPLDNASVSFIAPSCVILYSLFIWAVHRHLKSKEEPLTTPICVPPSDNDDRLDDLASSQRPSTIALFSLIPARLSSENLQSKNLYLHGNLLRLIVPFCFFRSFLKDRRLLRGKLPFQGCQFH